MRKVIRKWVFTTETKLITMVSSEILKREVRTVSEHPRRRPEHPWSARHGPHPCSMRGGECSKRSCSTKARRPAEAHQSSAKGTRRECAETAGALTGPKEVGQLVVRHGM